MQNRLRYILSVVVLVLAVYGCKKVINVDLNNVAAQIVIEGNITNLAPPYEVRVSKTVNFSASNVYPPVTGAIVKITDSTTGKTYQLNETDSGTYTTSAFNGTPRHRYDLLVIAGGQQYKATSTMPRNVALDSITFAENTDFNNNKDINAVVNFLDPVGPGNYYQFTETVNRRPIPNIFVFEDRLSDGKYIQQPLFNDSSYLQKGDTLQLNMYCIDQGIYNYFFTLMNVTGNNNFQSATPANPNTNISNGALGYFSAHTVNRIRLKVY
ncbi:MAG TPA: DUF4249 domain-containing protein [Puia sp.]|jgi:hypothetical protein